MHFSLSLPAETICGSGRLADLPEITRHFGTRVALARGGVSAEQTGLLARVHALLNPAGIETVDLPPQTREPEPADVDIAAIAVRQADVKAIIAIGGGSVLDLGKAVAALAPQDPAFSVRAYLEGIGEGRTLVADPLPLIAIPTTAGTGSEATKNAVISCQAERFKKSLRDRRMLAAVALIDPELTVGMPPQLTASTGMDALTQLIEAYTSNRANPVTNALALRGLRAARALPAAYHEGKKIDAREQMALAAFLSGVCLANAGLGAVHGIAAALGSVTMMSHGLACAIALPWVMAANLPVVTGKYAYIAETLTGRHFADADSGARAAIQYVWELMKELQIPRAVQVPTLAAALQDEQLPALAALCHGNSLRGNPRALGEADLIDLLRAIRDESDPLAFCV
ncbi:MAG: iron-containing alcohol dehydrogenase [Armatimonadota bacterium]